MVLQGIRSPEALAELATSESDEAVRRLASEKADSLLVAVACGDDEGAPEIAGSEFVVIRLSPAWTAEGGTTFVPTEVRSHDQAFIRQAGVTCTADQVVTWIAGATSASEVRVFEMRNPQRLVVDVR